MITHRQRWLVSSKRLTFKDKKKLLKLAFQLEQYKRGERARPPRPVGGWHFYDPGFFRWVVYQILDENPALIIIGVPAFFLLAFLLTALSLWRMVAH
jgi:hypothetical protein